jgi:hypothetical protein
MVNSILSSAGGDRTAIGIDLAAEHGAIELRANIVQSGLTPARLNPPPELGWNRARATRDLNPQELAQALSARGEPPRIVPRREIYADSETLKIGPESSAVDAGDTPPAGFEFGVDVDGEPRPFSVTSGGEYDIGADEYHP